MEPKTDPEEESDEAQIFIVRRGCKTVGLLQTEEIIVSLSLFSAEPLDKCWRKFGLYVETHLIVTPTMACRH